MDDGNLVLLIPLEEGVSEFVACTRGIGEIVEGVLRIVIPDAIDDRLGICVGSKVQVDNAGGKFNLRSSTFVQ